MTANPITCPVALHRYLFPLYITPSPSFPAPMVLSSREGEADTECCLHPRGTTQMTDAASRESTPPMPRGLNPSYNRFKMAVQHLMETQWTVAGVEWMAPRNLCAWSPKWHGLWVIILQEPKPSLPVPKGPFSFLSSSISH